MTAARARWQVPAAGAGHRRWYEVRRAVRLTVARFRPLVLCGLIAIGLLAVRPVVRPAPPATDLVLVAARDLPAGRVLTHGDLSEARWPRGSAPDGDLSREEAVVGGTLSSAVRRGEPFTDARLLGPGLLRGSPPGSVAVPVRIADPAAGALVRIGDVVDLYPVIQTAPFDAGGALDRTLTGSGGSPDRASGTDDDPAATNTHVTSTGAEPLGRAVRVLARLDGQASSAGGASGLFAAAPSDDNGSILVVAASPGTAARLAMASGTPIALVLRSS